MVNILNKNYQTGVTCFVCDKAEELDKLPKIGVRGKDNLISVDSCAMGSTVVITETSDRYILNGNTNKWIKLSSGSSGGGGGESGELATNEDIDKMFE